MDKNGDRLTESNALVLYKSAIATKYLLWTHTAILSTTTKLG